MNYFQYNATRYLPRARVIKGLLDVAEKLGYVRDGQWHPSLNLSRKTDATPMACWQIRMRNDEAVRLYGYKICERYPRGAK